MEPTLSSLCPSRLPAISSVTLCSGTWRGKPLTYIAWKHPRIHVCNRCMLSGVLTQTGGHGDLRMKHHWLSKALSSGVKSSFLPGHISLNFPNLKVYPFFWPYPTKESPRHHLLFFPHRSQAYWGLDFYCAYFWFQWFH